MKIKSIKIFLLFIPLLFTACGEGYNNHYAVVLREQREMPREKTQEDKLDERIIMANQIANEKEIQQIKGYIGRRNWNMIQLKTGVFVEIIEEGGTNIINSNSIVKIEVEIDLLNGERVFDSKVDGHKIINMAKEQSVIGLVYALEGRREGSVLRVAIPSFLAYGIIGDGDKIPKRAGLAYKIVIKEVN